MRYREWPPLPALAEVVACVWTLDGRADPEAEFQPVLPDGRPELLLHLGDPFEVDAGSGAARQPAMLFAGQLPHQILLRPTGAIAIVGLRFHPHGAAALLRESQQRLAGPPTALEDAAPRLARALSAVSSCGDLRGAAEHIQRELLRWIDRDALDPRVAHAVATIASARGQLAIDRVAAAAGMTRRHLERRFLEQVGLTPKRLARLTRFQRALRLLDDSSGARTAADCGYADQAHFVRDFRALAGCAPSDHLMRKAELTGFFIAPASTRMSSLSFPPRR